MRWLLWGPLIAAGVYFLVSVVCMLALFWLLSGAPEQPPHRTGGKPWET